ncbi:MAG: hypothetical protein KC457_21640 [Myxococcales bacterium]|nr:hypothetical protein [Myxococcales bacterium]
MRVPVAPLAELDAVVATGEVAPGAALDQRVGAIAGVAALVDQQVKGDQAQAAAALAQRRPADAVATGVVGLDHDRFGTMGADEAVAAIIGPHADDDGVLDRLAGGFVDDLSVEGTEQAGVGHLGPRALEGGGADDRCTGGQEEHDPQAQTCAPGCAPSPMPDP